MYVATRPQEVRTPMDFIINILLADRSRTQCDHCDRKDSWLDDWRFRSLDPGASCEGCDLCDYEGGSDMTTLCERCHRFLVREA